MRLITLVAICASALAAEQQAGAQCQYELTAALSGPECPPFGLPPTIGRDINDDGDVVGCYAACTLGPDQAFKWTADGGFESLIFPGANESEARGISGNKITGEFRDPDDEFGILAFLLDGADLTVILPPPGNTSSQGWAVNDDGVVVGRSSGGFVWEDGEMTMIQSSPLGYSNPRDINNAGQVVGHTGDTAPSNPKARGFIWEDGVLTLLDPIPGGMTSLATAINERGDMVGYGLVQVDGLGLRSHAFVRFNGEMADIGTLPGYQRSFGMDINEYRAVVGFCTDTGGLPDHGFIWQNGMMTDLNNLVDAAVDIRRAHAINNRGQITGHGGIPGATVAFVLTPVDPPLGDIDIDCQVGVTDFLWLLGHWGPCPPGDACRADLNRDGTVNADDLWILIGNWG